MEEKGFLITKHKFDFLGIQKKLEVIEIEDKVYLSADNLREVGFDVKWDEDNKLIIVRLNVK
jgi:hypothetical protein